MIAAALVFAAAAAPPSSPELGKAAGRCRADEAGPAFLVDVIGLKDRMGRLKLELYPADEQGFLADDNLLIAEGRPFARVEQDVPRGDAVTMCIRAPRPGPYALSLLHDRDGDRRFSLARDGVGFSNNPRLGLSKPHAAAATVIASAGLTHVRIVLNYRRGLLSLAPLRD